MHWHKGYILGVFGGNENSSLTRFHLRRGELIAPNDRLVRAGPGRDTLDIDWHYVLRLAILSDGIEISFSDIIANRWWTKSNPAIITSAFESGHKIGICLGSNLAYLRLVQ